MNEQTANTSLFPVFALSILSLVLLPWTIYKLCYSSGDDAAKLWETAESKRGLFRKLRAWMTLENGILIMLWIFAFLLVWHVNQTQKEQAFFDPFEILGVQPGASSGEIRRAYFEMSKIYHPDKNPDPKAHKYFAEKISKAYQALTDPVSKENYEKHGHPDGPQGIDLGIALPEWLFTKDPRALLLMVLVFILLPLSIMAWYLFRSDKYTGPNSIMQETLGTYAFSRHNVKESQGITRIPETLVAAHEFILMYTPNEQQDAVAELRKIVLSFDPKLKQKTQFWKRRASVVKAHLLLYAHLQRVHDEVPSALASDMRFVQDKSIPLLQEIVKIACMPRSPIGHGWLTPAISAIQVSQCITQAVPLSARKTQINKNVINEGNASLLQLPGMTIERARILEKKKIRTIHELARLEDGERAQILHSLDFADDTLHDVDTALQALPLIEMTAKIFVEDEDEIREGDTVTCQVRLLLKRKSHDSGDVSEDDLSRSGSVLCFSPNYPFSRSERWYIMVMLLSTNRVICWKHVVLKEAEKAAISMSRSRRAQSAFENSDEDVSQLVDMKFPAVKEGVYDVMIGCYSDCWIGADKLFPLKFTIKKASKNPMAMKVAARRSESDGDEEGDVEGNEEDEIGSKASDQESLENEDMDIADDYADEYDSEESGELETGTDEEEEEEKEKKTENENENVEVEKNKNE